MPLFAGLIGPTYRARSININAELARNVYLETVRSPTAIKQANFYGTPGIAALAESPTQLGGRGVFSQDGLTLTVIGTVLYEVDLTTSPVSLNPLGSVANDGKRVAFASNGRGGEQVAIRSSNELQILDLLTMALSGPVALPHTNKPTWLDFIDGYFVLGEQDTIRIWFSNLENGLIWDALDFFARSQTSDNVIGGKVFRDRIWTFGSLTSEVFYDSGDADNPFVPYPGSVMQEGLASQWAVAVRGESIVWVAQDTEGTNRIVKAQDYAPQVISNPSIGYLLAQCPTLSDSEVDVYEQEGHAFAAFTFPTFDPAGLTLCWDDTEQMWHERSSRNVALGEDRQWRVRGLCAVGGTLICGDWVTGAIGRLDLDVFEEYGSMIRRVRRAPYLSGENQWLFLDQFELGVQSGVGLPTGQGSDPAIALNISRDSGHTWESAGFGSLGPQGEYEACCLWVMLGRARADRLVVEVVQTDPVRCVWGPGAWLRVTPGSGLR